MYFSPNSEVGREKQNKIILFCYSLPTSEFGEKSLRKGVKIYGRSGNLNHTYYFLALIKHAFNRR